MSGIIQRIIGIIRSNAPQPEMVDNYTGTVERLDAAMISLTSTVNDLSSQRQALRESVANYLILASAYEAREKLLGKLIEDPAVINNPEVISLYETAKRLRGIAESSAISGHARMVQLIESITELKARRDGLKQAQSKLDLAQTMVTSKERLAKISSRSYAGELPIATDFSTSLREASALANEAVALAELKGLTA